MSDIDDQVARLESALSAQDSLRAALGDAAVDAVIGAIQAQISTLRAQQQGVPPVTANSSDQVLTQLQTYLPQELAEKMRTISRIDGERKQVTVMLPTFPASQPSASASTRKRWQSSSMKR